MIKIIENIKHLLGFKKKVSLEKGLLLIKTDLQTFKDELLNQVIGTQEEINTDVKSIYADVNALQDSIAIGSDKVTETHNEVSSLRRDLVEEFTLAKAESEGITLGLSKVTDSINEILVGTKEQSLAVASLFNGLASTASNFDETQKALVSIENTVKESSNTELFESKFKLIVDSQDKANVILLKDIRRTETKMEDISSKLESLIKAVNIIANKEVEVVNSIEIEDIRRVVNENRSAFVEDSVGRMANIVNKKFETINNESNRNSNKLEQGINLLAFTAEKTLDAIVDVRETVSDIEEDVNQVQEVQQETADTINMEIRPFIKGKKLSI